MGTGDVDEIRIMKNGNIQNFPQVLARSERMTCSDPVTTPTTFSWTGQVIVSSDAVSGDPTEVMFYSVAFNVVDDNKMSFDA